MYVNTFLIGYTGPTTTPWSVQGLKGGLNSLAEGGNNDERRFGQFSLRSAFSLVWETGSRKRFPS